MTLRHPVPAWIATALFASGCYDWGRFDGTPTGSARPDATNTGPHVSTFRSLGTTRVSDTQVLDGVELTGTDYLIVHDGANLTLRNCRITAVPGPITVEPGGLLTMEDCEIVLDSSASPDVAIRGDGITLRRVHAHGAGTVLQCDAMTGATTVTDSWFHADDSGGPISVRIDRGGPVTLQHNDLGGGRAVWAAMDDVTSLTVDDNWLDGGDTTLDAPSARSGVRITGNRFGHGYTDAPMSLGDPSAVVTGNVFVDTGLPVTR